MIETLTRYGLDLERSVNMKTLRSIQDLMGETGFSDLIACFIAESHQRVQTARRAFARGDAETVGQISHALKGAASTIGAERLANLAARLEPCSLGPITDSASAESLLRAMDMEVERYSNACRAAI